MIVPARRRQGMSTNDDGKHAKEEGDEPGSDHEEISYASAHRATGIPGL
jgi:hypothetical protein